MSARAIVVERAGLQSLIVDRGRFGLRHFGVGWCGAMDLRALADANALAGNPPNAAAIEIVLGDFALSFEAAARFALAGADCDAQLDGEGIATYHLHTAQAGSRLVLHRPRAWMRTVLALDGGIRVAPVLGSRTTDLLAHMGGIGGRALRAGDRLILGEPAIAPTGVVRKQPPCDFVFRVLRQALAERLWDREWTVGHESNRMGYRLRGDAQPHDLGSTRSRAVFPGFIQLPPSGEPIVLMSDAQTTGGYPLAGVVIEEDLWKLAQAPIGARIRFISTSMPT
ncbi:MAG TPA: biotin-dependent carboxyltransferase family protein [Candidatus Baltobacteraceae bacterium]|nr:biotin-dependent carboxyltransferase family protein [Candidatus Baltobacteraceae bacterium]